MKIPSKILQDLNKFLSPFYRLTNDAIVNLKISPLNRTAKKIQPSSHFAKTDFLLRRQILLNFLNLNTALTRPPPLRTEMNPSSSSREVHPRDRKWKTPLAFCFLSRKSRRSDFVATFLSVYRLVRR